MLKCPNCGATINKQGFVVACDYCGTSVRVQRRTGFFQRVERPPVQLSQAALELPLVVQRHTRRWVLAFAFLPLIVIGALGVGIFSVIRHEKQRVAATQGPKWDVQAPVIVDVDGDGVADVVGRLSANSSKKTMLAAYSGTSGKRLWISESIAPRSSVLHTALGVTRSAVIIADDNGGLTAVKLADGTTLWRASFPERTKRFCQAEPGAVVAELEDKSKKQLSLTDGSVTESSINGCEVLAHDDPDETGPHKRIIERGGDGESTPNEKHFDGMSVRGAVASPLGVTVAFGNKTPGHRAPMLARYILPEPPAGSPDPLELEEQAEMSSGRERMELRRAAREAQRAREALVPDVVWQAIVPGIAPLKASEGTPEPEYLAISEDIIAAAYRLDGGGHNYRLTAFALADGKRLWDVGLSETMPLNGVAISKESVFVSRWGSVKAFDARTGAVKWSAK